MSDDPESTIPWPGFVDILSTVIIVFVFFMMMTSVIIFLMSQQQQQEAVEAAKEQAKTETLQELVEQQQSIAEQYQGVDIQQVLAENQQLKQQVDKLVRIKSVVSESEAQTVRQQATGLRISYGDLGVTLLPKTAADLKQQVHNTRKVYIKAFVPQAGNYGATREIALNRALNIRNALMQHGVPASNISLKIMTTSSADSLNGHVDLEF